MQYISVSLFVFFIALFCLPAYGQQGGIDYTKPGALLPYFRLKVADTILITPADKKEGRRKKDQPEPLVAVKATLTGADLNGNTNLFIMLFSPTCEHCAAETGLLEQHIELFKNNKLVLVTNPRMQADLPEFIKKQHTLDYPQLTVGYDDSEYIKETFIYETLPQINIYSKERKLLKTYTGDIPIDSLRAYLY